MATPAFVVTVLGLKDYAESKDHKLSAHFAVTLLNDLGQPIGKPIKSKSVKLTAVTASAPISIEFPMPPSFAGIGLQCISKGIFKDKQLGVITIKFNTQLISGNLVLDDWFGLSSRRKDNKVFAKAHLKISEKNVVVKPVVAGVVGEPAQTTAPAPAVLESSHHANDEEKQPNNPLKVSSKWANQDSKLKSSTFVVIEEDDDDDNDVSDEHEHEIVPSAPPPSTTDQPPTTTEIPMTQHHSEVLLR